MPVRVPLPESKIMGLRAIHQRPQPETDPKPLAPAKPALSAEEVNRLRFEEYLERFRRPIYIYVHRLVRDSHIAEDITQETFVRLYREIASIRDETASAWTYRVARNLVTDYKRKKKPVLFTVLRGNSASDDEDGHEPLQFEGNEPSPVDRSYQNELQAALDDVLGRMSSKFRDPLILCDVEKLTYEQAAEVLGCSVKTVSARLHRAREFVSGCLKKYLAG
jgi:RNA polymerase sigma-70 factor (ECF subfamily)